jgi:methyl-accepting chemotaxis protein
MVEEASAASASLASESATLRELIGQFNVGSAAAQQAYPLRKTA